MNNHGIWVLPLSKTDTLTKWGEISDMLEKAIKYEDGRYDVKDIRQMVIESEAQIWVAVKGTELYGVVVTHIAEYPKKTMLFVLCLAGKEFDLWDNVVEDNLIPYAKHYECSGIEFYGRKGWSKRAAHLGFVPLHYVYNLQIKDDENAKRTGHIYELYPANAGSE